MINKTLFNEVLNIPACWNIHKNDFVNLDPDNVFNIEEVADYFVEDILQATWDCWVVDLGFYGDYYDNRSGTFRVYIIRGDFLNGQLYEVFSSRSVEKVKERVVFFLQCIPNGVLDGLLGLDFGEDNETSPEQFEDYSLF